MPSCTRADEIAKIVVLEKGQNRTQMLVWFSIIVGLVVEVVKVVV